MRSEHTGIDDVERAAARDEPGTDPAEESLPREAEPSRLAAVRRVGAAGHPGDSAGAPDEVTPAGPFQGSGPRYVRHPKAVGLVAIAALALVLGYAGMYRAWRAAEAQAARARAEEAAAVAARARAEASLEQAQGLVRELREVAEKLSGRPRFDRTRRDLLERILAYHASSLARQPDDPAGQYHSALAVERVGWIRGELGQVKPAAEALRKAGTLLDRLLERSPDDPRYRSSRAWTYYWSGRFQLGREHDPAAAFASHGRAIAIMEPLVAEFPRAIQYRSALARFLAAWAPICSVQGDPADADRAFVRVVALQRDLLKHPGQSRGVRRDLALALEGYGELLLRTDRTSRAESAFRESAGLMEVIVNNNKSADETGFDLTRVQRRLAELFEGAGRSAEAEECLRQSCLGLRHLNDAIPGVVDYRRAFASTALAYADLQDARGHPERALENYREALDQSTKLVADFPEDDTYANDLAWLLATLAPRALRDPERAVRLATRAVTLAPGSARDWTTLGVARYRAGDPRSARTALEKSLDLGSGTPAAGWFFLAMAAWKLGEEGRAHEGYAKAMRALEEKPAVSPELRRFHDEARTLLHEPTPPQELIP